MLQKLGDHIANCLARADDAERRAAETWNQALRLDDEKLAHSWRHLAASYQFVESLERLLLNAEKARGARPHDAPSALAVRPPGPVFDPDTIAVLTAAYHKTIEGQPVSARQEIAKRIIDLASEGERDPDKLYQGARALPLCTGGR